MTQSEKQKMLAGELFNAFDNELVSERDRAHQLFSELNSVGKSNPEKRHALIEDLFGNCGKDIWVESPFYCDYGYLISVGDNVFINYNCTILDSAKVTIGDNVLLGPGVQLYAATHPIDPAIRAQGLEFSQEIVIEDDVWIGGSVVVCPGVRIGGGSVIGAGSVVTKDIPSGVVAAGNPCKVIKQCNAT